jgi:hypothetical protein
MVAVRGALPGFPGLSEHRAPLGRLDLLAAMAINIRPLRGQNPPYPPLWAGPSLLIGGGNPPEGPGKWMPSWPIEIRNPQSPIRNPQSPIPNPQSPIRNPQSPIPNPQSPIRNPTPGPLAQGASGVWGSEPPWSHPGGSVWRFAAPRSPFPVPSLLPRRFGSWRQ